MEYYKDDRFKCIATDPKFKSVPRREKKVTIDPRFKSMFTDKKFQLKYSVDKRGRPIKLTQSDDLTKYYDLSLSEEEVNDDDKSSEEVSDTDENEEENDAEKETSESECDLGDKVDQKTNIISKSDEKVVNDEEVKKKKMDKTKIRKQWNEIDRNRLTGKVKERLQDISIDYARGQGTLVSESSSSDEESSEDSEEEVEHAWGQLDHDAETTDDATSRLALCNLDWDRVTANDLFVVISSFLPPTGVLHSVTVYPSEFGMERMKEEELKGPKELTEHGSQQIETKDEDEDDPKHMEKLREYQLKRLRYYYAVAEFDCAQTADKVYTECNNMEYESSATKLDMRFIPDDMTFDQDPRDKCDSLPDAKKYKPLLFANTALRQGKVELTWDETDPNREELSKKFSSCQDIDPEQLRALVAISSEESSDSDGEKDVVEVGEKTNEKDAIAKYRCLLADIEKAEEEKNKDKVEMEISWDPQLERKAKEKEEQQNTEKMTPFEKLMHKRKEKRKKRNKAKEDNLLSDDDLPEDVDLSDPFFSKELEKQGKMSKGRRSKGVDSSSGSEHDDNEALAKGELDLLLAEDEDVPGKKHFSLKEIQAKEELIGKKKNKKKNKWKEEELVDNFQIDVADERFSSLFTSHLYNIDPSDSHFRKTRAMEIIQKEKLKRRYDQSDSKNAKRKKQEKDSENSIQLKSSTYVVKRKSKMNT